MKLLLALVLSVLFLKGHAQSKPKTDTTYYLLDTAKTPLNDRIWEVGIMLPFNYYAINCSCLAYDQQLTFMHPIADTGKNITREQLKSIKLTDIGTLIKKGKRYINNDFKGYTFFIIEPKEKKYLMHRVGVVPQQKPYTIIDSITLHPDTTKKN